MTYINVEIGIAYGEGHGTWDTMIINQKVHDHLTEEEIGNLALSEAARRIEEDVGGDARARGIVAHMWVHYIDLDEPEEEEEEGEEKRVFLRLDDQDHHDAGCDCGSCNANGKAYGVGIYEVGDDEPLVRIYRASEDSAFHDAILHVGNHGWLLVEEDEEEETT